MTDLKNIFLVVRSGNPSFKSTNANLMKVIPNNNNIKSISALRGNIQKENRRGN